MTFRILIADDEALIRRDLREMLEELGHVVVAEARKGTDIGPLVQAHKPDVLLLDIVMPGMSGIDAAKALADEYPIVMLTAHSSADLVLAARDAGAMAYLTKPVRKNDIGPSLELAVTHFLRESLLTDKVRTLSSQLETRKLVDRAKSLMMQRMHCTEADAHRQLQALSMAQNLSLREVAQTILSGNV